MTPHADRSGLTRRDVLAAGVAATGMTCRRPDLLARPTGSAGRRKGITAPSRWDCKVIRCAVYHLRAGADLKKALAATKDLGVHYWEAFPATFP